MGYEWVWRLDDDTVAEPNTLENLFKHVTPEVGAVGGSVLTPPFAKVSNSTGKIDDIEEANLQWDYIKEVKEVDHLHCSFLYRAGVHDYNLGLSQVAHREETLFTFGLKQKGYKNLIVPDTVTWHLKNKKGGIRDFQIEMFQHDEYIFRNYLKYRDKTVVVLDNGMGDHIIFSHVLPHIKNAEVFSCYPDIVPGRSIAEAMELFGDIDCYSIYRKMDQWNWKDSLENAFKKMYGVK
jgi:GT2 family glycosyltransferase